MNREHRTHRTPESLCTEAQSLLLIWRQCWKNLKTLEGPQPETISLTTADNLLRKLSRITRTGPKGALRRRGRLPPKDRLISHALPLAPRVQLRSASLVTFNLNSCLTALDLRPWSGRQYNIPGVLPHPYSPSHLKPSHLFRLASDCFMRQVEASGTSYVTDYQDECGNPVARVSRAGWEVLPVPATRPTIPDRRTGAKLAAGLLSR